jgi:transcriptional regulator with XRE-family HTH domain
MSTRSCLTLVAQRVEDAYVTNSLPERIAGEIRAELARRRMTQSALAEKIGRSPMYVWRRLSDQSTALDIADLEAIAKALELPVEHLLGERAA